MSTPTRNAVLAMILVGAVASGLLFGTAFPAAASHTPDSGLVPCGTSKHPEPCTICHIAVLVVNLTTFLMKNIAFPAAVLLITIGGLTLLTAGPSEGRRTTGKQIITTTIVGLIIVLVAWIAVDTAIKVLTGNFNFAGPPGILIQAFGPWNNIDLSRGCPIG